MTPGIHRNTAEEYHGGPGVGRSGLWTIYKQTPAHFRYGERAETNAFAFGQAGHIAVLEPETFEARVMRGPDDRRGNRWKDAELHAASEGALLLTSGDYDAMQAIRDSAERSATLRVLRDGAMIEHSGYAMMQPDDRRFPPVLCRVRPDAYHPGHATILDLKTTVAGGRAEFGRAVLNYGYHFQEAAYTDVWVAALKSDVRIARQILTVDAFVFVAIEKKPPYLVSTYELDPATVEEGRAAFRLALNTYAECLERERLNAPPYVAWPGYPDDPTPLSIPRYGFIHTPPPAAEE